jgi:hypothetical protein
MRPHHDPESPLFLEWLDATPATPPSLAVVDPAMLAEPRTSPNRKVVAERERRLALGFDYDFADERGVHRIGTTAGDWMGWREVSLWAEAQRALGRSDDTFLAIVTDTGPVMVSPADWARILDAATTNRQPIWHASFALQTMNPIPANLADDEYWP